MEQLEIFDIPNPCRGICQTNSRGLCLGCFRTRKERFEWQRLTLAEQQNVLRLMKQRKGRLLRELRRQQLDASRSQNLSQQNELPF